MDLSDLPRFELALLPTPVQPLPRLSDELGVKLSVKRDDLTGLAFGGNKTRKLDLLVAQARRQGADTLVTVGAEQSNHCRQTAAAAARAGLACTLVLHGSDPGRAQGNVLLDRMLGAHIVWADDRRLDLVQNEMVAALEARGRKPYAIPYGGSNSYGAAAYAQAMKELLESGHIPERIVLASSSGGTQAGLLLGAALYGFRGRVTGISVDPGAEELSGVIDGLIRSAVTTFDLEVGSIGTVEVVDDYLGEGYAIVGDRERNALRVAAREEGLLLDPVYTGRAFGGMMGMIREGRIGLGERVLFWHTGGTPALFAYGEEVLSRTDTSS